MAYNSFVDTKKIKNNNSDKEKDPNKFKKNSQLSFPDGFVRHDIKTNEVR
jgi:hypothetical protein